MRIAIMQPYIFPYLGYFQLIKQVDRFIVLDDVNFIKKGWINRNRIVSNGEARFFNIPLLQISQHKKIRDTLICETPPWRAKFLKQIEEVYRKSNYFENIFPIIEKIANYRQAEDIAAFNTYALEQLCDYLQIDTEIIRSSVIYENAELKGSERIIDICIKNNCREYLNLPGGKLLYNSVDFKERNIELLFLHPELQPYFQPVSPFIPNLSILDVLMHNSADGVKAMLEHCNIERST